MTEKLEWHALYNDGGEGEPWMAYVEGHHDLGALACTAEKEIRDAFPCHECAIAEYLDEAGGAPISHYWLKTTGKTGCDDQPLYEVAKAHDHGAFAVTGVRF